MRTAISLLLRCIVRACPRDKQLLVCLIMILILAIVARVNAAQFEYRGVYKVESVLVNYCTDCYLELPPDFLNSEFVLSVETDSEKSLFKSLQASSRAIGWTLSRVGSGRLKAEPIQNEGNVVYISCLDNLPHNVPKYLYTASVASDKILCAKRDSTERAERERADSLRAVADSVASLPPLDFGNYHLRYFAYSKSFTDKMGLEWNAVLAEGNLHNRISFFDDWRLWATENNDTSFTERGLLFSVDTTISVDWGSEEQTLKTTFVNDGVTQSDYEWRKYGIIVSVTRDGSRVKMDYTFRDKDNNVSVLQGSVIGDEGDTLRLFGTYTSRRNVQSGIPFLCRIPIFGYLFATNTSENDIRAFELYLLPISRDEKNNHGQIK